MRLPLPSWIFLLAGLLGPGIVHSVAATASATASIIAPANVTSAAFSAIKSAAFSAVTSTDFSAVASHQIIFSTSTGVLTIRLMGAPASAAEVATACSAGRGCNAATTLQLTSDGTLNAENGVSMSFLQSDDNKAIVMAMLSYN